MGRCKNLPKSCFRAKVPPGKEDFQGMKTSPCQACATKPNLCACGCEGLSVTVQLLSTQVSQSKLRTHSGRQVMGIICFLRMPGVEPGSQAWEACMMPLHYMRHARLRGGVGGRGAWQPAGFRTTAAMFQGTRRGSSAVGSA